MPVSSPDAAPSLGRHWPPRILPCRSGALVLAGSFRWALCVPVEASPLVALLPFLTTLLLFVGALRCCRGP